MGSVHLSAIESLESATLTAVSSRTPPTADRLPQGSLSHLKTGALPADVHWYANWRELVTDPNVDAVDICLPTWLHKEVALSALENGKHVLCEKPMALTSSDCDQMLDEAGRSGRIFMVAHVLRFMSSYRYAASFVSSVCRGSVTACTMRRKSGYPKWGEWLSREEYSGGAILDLLIHDIDQALKLFGQPNTVSAVNDGEIDTVKGTLRYANGLEVQIEGGWYAPGMPFSSGFRITGEDADLSFEGGKLQLTLSGHEQTVDIPKQSEYTEQMSYFAECCRNNTAPELCLPSESAQAVRLANLLKASRNENGKELSC
jgi:predicted dehydrogenase